MPRVVAVLAGVLAALLATPYLPGARTTDGWAVPTANVDAHLRSIHAELQTMLDRTCGGEARVPSPWAQTEGDVHVPSCAALAKLGLERYYAILNMLLVEAWVGKILPALRALAAGDAGSDRDDVPADLITVRADGTAAGDLGGAIFAAELRADKPADVSDGQKAALMLGIHRTPRHKARNHVDACHALITMGSANS